MNYEVYEIEAFIRNKEGLPCPLNTFVIDNNMFGSNIRKILDQEFNLIRIDSIKLLGQCHLCFFNKEGD